jgi:hypothetical protein
MARIINHETVGTPEQLVKTLNAMQTEITALTTLANELLADHATLIASVGEIETWAETLAAKLNADGGVTDENYDAVITNSPPATLTAAAVTAQTTKSY